MATAAESQSALSLTPTNSRSSFSRPFKRKPKKASDAGSVGSATQSPASEVEGGPFALRRNSTDSGRKLSIRLGGRKRSKIGLGSRTESESGSSVLSQTPAGVQSEGVSPGATPGESEEYYTEEDEDSTPQKPTRPQLSAHNSHIGYLTASSPLITTQTVDSSPPPATNSTDSLAADALNPQKLQAPPSSARRSPSPVGRLKDAFKVRRADTSPSGRPNKAQEETRPATSGGSVVEERKSRARKDSLSRQIFTDQQLVEEPGEKTPSPAKTKNPRQLVTKLPSTPPAEPAFDGSPATVVTPPTPTDASHSRNLSADSIKTPDAAHTSTGGNLSHRRVKSAGQPSKLSNAISAPLTPAIEEVKTPGGTITSPTATGGFFSSMFSAAQTAANSLTNTIAVTSGNRARSSTDPSKVGGTGSAGEEVILGSPGVEKKNTLEAEGKRQLAIETLGSGNLSLSHLGISESKEVSPMNSSTDLVSGLKRDEDAARREDESAARAVSMAYSEVPTVNGIGNGGAGVKSQTPSVVDTTEQIPMPLPAELDTGSIRRAGSVRSRLSGRRRTRTRGSSATTGQTQLNPTITGPGSTVHKLPGFSVAPQKRQREFHNLFRSVPEDDFLIEDYAAALQRDILLQGRIYISEGHICFSSNILGWVTNLVMSYDEILSVEKKATAYLFQNGIVIQTLQAKNVFASLLMRDATYELIVSIWRITHPHLRSTTNGMPVEGGGTGDKTEKIANPAGEESSAEEVYDEDEEGEDEDDEDADDGDASTGIGNEGSMAGPDDTTVETLKVAKRSSSNAVGALVQNGTAKPTDAVETIITGASATLDFPGPATHTPTECGDASSHLERILYEDTIPAPLGKIYSLMFGPASGKFMRKWLVEDQKCFDLQFPEDDGKGLDNEHKAMTFSYIKPLSGSIGPKQTKCIINSVLEQFDLNKSVSVLCATQNPDVPSGNIFVVKTRYCLSWAPGNATRFLATCQIEWSGKSWLKGPIEKGANEGQLQYQKDIVAALKSAVVLKPALKGGTKGRGRDKARRKNTGESAAEPTSTATANATKAPEVNWGIFEPLRGPLGPVAEVVSPSVIIAFLSITVLLLYFRSFSSNATSTSTSLSGLNSAQRVAAYEELWRKEESELWKWIEQRAGVQEGGTPAFLTSSEGALGKRGGDGRGKAGKYDEEMEARKVREAIRVTRERLEALEGAVGRGGETKKS